MLLSLIVFPLISPILLYIAYKIKKEEPHSSIFFKQERLGKKGKIFICYKFRTMYEKSEEKLQQYLKKYPEEIRYYETFHKYQNDPRITPIGHFLRKTSLDELPQIFNVFKNQMSFIGPRPYMLNEEEKIGKHTQTILTVKPGITGLWQVSGRNEVDFYSRVALDTWYIRNWNLWLDIMILFKTVKTVLLRESAS
jgi:undecaprenyl-phosphate galactose phosphotransferase